MNQTKPVDTKALMEEAKTSRGKRVLFGWKLAFAA
jgi:hypothetical protein